MSSVAMTGEQLAALAYEVATSRSSREENIAGVRALADAVHPTEPAWAEALAFGWLEASQGGTLIFETASQVPALVGAGVIQGGATPDDDLRRDALLYDHIERGMPEGSELRRLFAEARRAGATAYLGNAISFGRFLVRLRALAQ